MSDPIVVPVITKSRHKGHKPYNSLVRDDGLKYVRAHPDNFEALLYLPVETAGTAPVDDWLDGESFSRPDVNQAPIEGYQNPIAVSVLEQPRASDPVDVDQAGDDEIGYSEEYLVVNLDVDNVPVGAALEFDDELSDDGPRRVFWYVQKISTRGSTKAGATYYLIPLPDFIGVLP